jgi:hypothetical protein
VAPVDSSVAVSPETTCSYEYLGLLARTFIKSVQRPLNQASTSLHELASWVPLMTLSLLVLNTTSPESTPAAYVCLSVRASHPLLGFQPPLALLALVRVAGLSKLRGEDRDTRMILAQGMHNHSQTARRCVELQLPHTSPRPRGSLWGNGCLAICFGVRNHSQLGDGCAGRRARHEMPMRSTTRKTRRPPLLWLLKRQKSMLTFGWLRCTGTVSTESERAS